MTDPLPKEVLVVEDEPVIRMVAADALADAGIVAWEAGDADEALTTMDQHPRIGLIFTDINMPGEMNGLDLARELSVTRPDIELVITSGAVILQDCDLPDHGTFLAKPYPTQTLVNIVAQKLDSTTKRGVVSD